MDLGDSARRILGRSTIAAIAILPVRPVVQLEKPSIRSQVSEALRSIIFFRRDAEDQDGYGWTVSRSMLSHRLRQIHTPCWHQGMSDETIRFDHHDPPAEVRPDEQSPASNPLSMRDRGLLWIRSCDRSSFSVLSQRDSSTEKLASDDELCGFRAGQSLRSSR